LRPQDHRGDEPRSMKSEVAVIPAQRIERVIYLIRGQKVMLDRHLAQLYGVETRVLNQAVRRNKDRFPNDFMFTLTRQEIRDLSQIVISPGLKHAPNVFAFTEQGVAMLSSVLNNPRAIKVNLEIMRAFVRLRGMMAPPKEVARKKRNWKSIFKIMMSRFKPFLRPSGNGWLPRKRPRSGLVSN